MPISISAMLNTRNTQIKRPGSPPYGLCWHSGQEKHKHTFTMWYNNHSGERMYQVL